MRSEQASSASYDDEYDDERAWLQEVGNPYRSMVAAAVAEPVVAAAFCYPADYWAHPMSRPVRRLIRRMRAQARWDDRLPGLGTRQSVVALTDRSLLVFEYRIGRGGGGLGPCLERWARDAISLGAWRTELVQSSNGQTNRMDLLQLNAARPTARWRWTFPLPTSLGSRNSSRRSTAKTLPRATRSASA